jgi:hypothetical protein
MASSHLPRPSVSISSDSLVRNPSQIPSVSSRPVEVDWMRSDGSVRMIQDPRAGTPIIWVTRRSQVPQLTRRGIRKSDSRESAPRRSLQQRVPTATFVSK